MPDNESNRLIHMQLMGRDTYLLGRIRVAITENNIEGSHGRVYVFSIIEEIDRKNYKIGHKVARVYYDSGLKEGNQKISSENDLFKIVIGCGNRNNLFLDTVSRRRDAASKVIKLILDS